MEEEETNGIKNIIQFNRNLLAHQRCITLLRVTLKLQNEIIQTFEDPESKKKKIIMWQQLFLCRLANNFRLKYIFWKTW